MEETSAEMIENILYINHTELQFSISMNAEPCCFDRYFQIKWLLVQHLIDHHHQLLYRAIEYKLIIASSASNFVNVDFNVSLCFLIFCL